MCDQSRWHVVEAKGRSGKVFPSVVEGAKRQAARISSVFGEEPATNSACVTSLLEDPITMYLDDPPPDGEVSSNFPEKLFWEHYYGGFSRYIREFEEVSPLTKSFRGYVFASLQPLFSELPGKLTDAIGPLPTIIGLPKTILEEPDSAPEAIRSLAAEGYPVREDGLLLLGPIGKREKSKRE